MSEVVKYEGSPWNELDEIFSLKSYPLNSEKEHEKILEFETQKKIIIDNFYKVLEAIFISNNIIDNDIVYNFKQSFRHFKDSKKLNDMIKEDNGNIVSVIPIFFEVDRVLIVASNVGYGNFAGALIFETNTTGIFGSISRLFSEPNSFISGYHIRAVQVFISQNPKYRESLFYDDFKKISDDYDTASRILLNSKDEFANTKNNLDKSLKDAQKKINKFVSESERIKKAVSESIKLDSANKFYEKKSKTHNNNFKILISLFFLIVVYISFHFIDNFFYLKEEFLSVAQGGQSLSALLFFTAPVLLLAWILRLILKLAMQQNSLAIDASMRSTMINVFVALKAEGETVEAEERLVMLNSIFRPLGATSGDDVHPPSLADLAEMIRTNRT